MTVALFLSHGRVGLSSDQRLAADAFPRSAKYDTDWVLSGAGGGANPLWLAEWLCEALELRPGMRVLDLGCGRALSSIFLHREFDVEVWAADLWFSASENLKRIQAAGVEAGVFPLQANARELPFAEGFFDAVVSIDSFMFYGTDDLYLNDLIRFVKPGGLIGIAQAGLKREWDSELPSHLAEWGAAEMVHCLHSADWWRRHWRRSRAVEVLVADDLPDGWRYWQRWIELIAPENEVELTALAADQGQQLGYVRAVGRRLDNAMTFNPNFTIPAE